MVLRLSLALARSGHLVFIPDLPGIAGGELSPATLAASIEYVQAAADSGETAHGRVGLAGVSVGASLALLRRPTPGWPSASPVVCVAPYTDMANVMLLATTGMYPARRLRAVRGARVSLGRARAFGDRDPAPRPRRRRALRGAPGVDPAAPDPARFRDRSFRRSATRPASSRC